MFSIKVSKTVYRMFGLSLVCAVLGMVSAPAFAGFEWVPPQGQAPVAPPSPVAKVEAEPLTTQPSAQIHAQPLAAPMSTPAPTPAPVAATNVPPAIDAPTPLPASTPPVAVVTSPAASPAADPVATITPAPVAAAAPAPVQSTGKLIINPFPTAKTDVTLSTKNAAPMPVAAPAASSAVYGTVVGFGSDLPLPLALNQVVPAGYAYSFGEGVNPGVRVSWDGGQPWNVVLNAMLAPQNLEAVISGNAVMIKTMSGPGKMSAAIDVETPIAVPPLAVSDEMAAKKTEAVAEVAINQPEQPTTEDTSAIDPGLRRKNVVDPGPASDAFEMSAEEIRNLSAITPAAGSVFIP
jgi:hypothetical protein